MDVRCNFLRRLLVPSVLRMLVLLAYCVLPYVGGIPGLRRAGVLAAYLIGLASYYGAAAIVQTLRKQDRISRAFWEGAADLLFVAFLLFVLTPALGVIGRASWAVASYCAGAAVLGIVLNWRLGLRR